MLSASFVFMKKNYYISNILFEVDSEIPLDEYEAEEQFQKQILSVEDTYQVKVVLTESIHFPDEKPIELDHCRVWMNLHAEQMCDNGISEHDLNLCDELRIYFYEPVGDYAISTEIFGNVITIRILKSLWGTVMHNFRIWSYIFLERILLQHQALILHSASIMFDGQAILFTAPSETGKTTQTDIWHRNDDSVEDLNGDRTILQKTSDGWIACGIPISGTSTRCVQAALPIGAIAIVQRATEDSISRPSLIKKIQFLYGQITVFAQVESDAEKVLALLEDLVKHINILQLNCTMNDSAYEVLMEELKTH